MINVKFGAKWNNPKGSTQSTELPENPLPYNQWFAFIHRIEPIQNTVKPGGVCLDWAMEKTLQQAKDVLKND